MKRKRLKPRICGHCIYYNGDSESGFCELNEEEPEPKYYNEVACNLGKRAY
jgi:hypothetical protein